MSGGGNNGSNPFSGVANNEVKYFRATTSLEVEQSGASAPPSGGGKGGGITTNAMEGEINTNNNQTIGGDIVSSAVVATDSSKYDIEITGKKQLYKVGNVLTIGGDDWNTTKVTLPTNPTSGDDLDLLTVNVESNHIIKSLNESPATKTVTRPDGQKGNEVHIQIYM